MSNHLLPEQPAYSLLLPSAPKFMSVALSEESELRSSLAKGELFGMVGSSRFFMFMKPDGSKVFLKRIRTEALGRQIEADLIARSLIAKGIRSICLLDDYPVNLSDGNYLLGYENVEHRFADSISDDITRLGLLIGRLHQALSDLPSNRSYIDQTHNRLEMLRTRAKTIVTSHGENNKLEQLRDLLVKDEGLLDNVLQVQEEATHGDLHYTNVLFPLDGGEPIVLDFEDVPSSCFPPILDLALALERFVICQKIDKEEQQKLGIELFSAYGMVRDLSVTLDGFVLEDCLRTLSLRALLTLAEMEAQNHKVEDTEWEKFFSLYEQAQSSTGLLNNIISAVN